MFHRFLICIDICSKLWWHQNDTHTQTVASLHKCHDDVLKSWCLIQIHKLWHLLDKFIALFLALVLSCPPTDAHVETSTISHSDAKMMKCASFDLSYLHSNVITHVFFTSPLVTPQTLMAIVQQYILKCKSSPWKPYSCS